MFGVLRSLEFYLGEVKYLFPGGTGFYSMIDPSKAGDPIKWSLDTDRSVTGTSYQTEWKSEYNAFTSDTPFRIIIVFSVAKEIDSIVGNNGHNSGNDTFFGIKDIVISVTEEELVQADTAMPMSLPSTLPGAVEIFNGLLNEHVSADVRDDQIIWEAPPPSDPLVVNISLSLGYSAEVYIPSTPVQANYALKLGASYVAHVSKSVIVSAGMKLNYSATVTKEVRVVARARLSLAYSCVVESQDNVNIVANSALKLKAFWVVDVAKTVNADISLNLGFAAIIDTGQEDCRLLSFKESGRWC